MSTKKHLGFLKLITLVIVVAASALFGWHTMTLAARPVPEKKVAIKKVLPTPIPTARPTPVPTPVPTPLPTPTPTPTAAPRQTADTTITDHIAMYHYVRDNVDPKEDSLGYNLSVRPAELEQHIQYFIAAGYHPITMHDLMTGRGDPKALTLTFDDGYEDFYTTAAPILEKYHWTATLYIIANKIGGPYMSWDQIRELQHRGFEIGAHTLNHPDLSKLSVDRQHEEIFDSKKIIEQQIGVPVESFCYPSGRYNDDTVRLVKEAGYTSATTTIPGSVHTGDNQFLFHRVRMNPDMTNRQLSLLFP